jgi:UDP-2,3-diacylglucosamine pyrophosphatase LpxH
MKDQTSPEQPKNPFLNAKYTAIISDIHLTEAEPEHPAGNLWKKFKSREFFFDDTLSDFFEYIQEKTGTETAELILNGDVFDFDSVMSIPEDAPFRITWLEKTRGLFPEEVKASYKMQKILSEHAVFVEALRKFIKQRNHVVIVIGNHDLELHFPQVQNDIIYALNLTKEEQARVRFCEWFYISNQDTLVEHGNQYDPYCLCQNPIHPLIQKFNRVEIRLPFGDLAGRYMTNGMGFFNPHVDSNFIMSFGDYLKFFTKYLIRTQPMIMWTWFWSSIVVLCQSFLDRLLPALKDPLTVEDRVNDIAERSNATPRMVRELRELSVTPATSNPIRLARELWLDRAFIMLIGFIFIFQIFALIKLALDISFFWMFIPLFILVPFFVFYAKSIDSDITAVKEPNEWILSVSARIARVKRVIYGHTHIARHEYIGEVEHLNSGCWTPAFLDVECTKPMGKKTYIWIEPGENGQREAQLREFIRGDSYQIKSGKRSAEDDAPTKIEVSS